jgi:NADH dehydrogenase
MTVLVTGASGVVGRAAVRALLARDEVRATVRRADAADQLRAVGTKVSVRSGEQADELAEILPRCHTLIHLTGGVVQPDPEALAWANHGSVLVALRAAREAGTKRVVFLSVPGADPEHPHPFLRAKGLAEEAVAAAGVEYAIVRSAHVFGLGGSWFTALVEGASASPPFVCGPGTQEVAPVYADDVGAMIAAIDDHAAPVAGTWGLEGPTVLSVDELVAVLRDDDERPAHADGQAAAATLSSMLGAPVDAVAASFFAMPSRADAPDAAAAFEVHRTPLLEGLRATLAAASSLDAG